METATKPDVENEADFDCWAVLELMGHRRLIGHLTEQEVGGQKMLRIDVLSTPPATQYYGPGAVYCITPVTEATARRAANLNRVAPVQRWELPEPPGSHPGEEDLDEDEGDPDHLTGPAPF